MKEAPICIGASSIEVPMFIEPLKNPVPRESGLGVVIFLPD